MQLGSGWAPGKAILFGEHAVVYGRPALAVPVLQLRAQAVVTPGDPGAGVVIDARDTGERLVLRAAPDDHPLAAVTRLALAALGLGSPDWVVTVSSSIPIASGLGSGAAVSAAIVRALAAAAGQPISSIGVSELVYEVEKLHHGSPSGIDNTVIAYAQPVYFVRGETPQACTIGKPFLLAIADSGIASPTKVTVKDVRRRWEHDPVRFEALFDRVGAIVGAARMAIEGGHPERLGSLMDRNHDLLRQMGVSSPELDALVASARSSGASGAKLSGGGRGGNLIALVTEETASSVASALRAAGAAGVIVTMVG